MLDELTRPLRVSADLQHEVEQFLYLEAALLDDRRLREWLDLLADDIEYTLDTNSLAQFRDRRRGWAPPTTYIFHEDKYQLERRVARVETGQAWAEEPASRTRHFVTNVRVLAQADDELVVGCNYLVHRASKAHDHHSFIGTRRDTLRRIAAPDGGETFTIARRRLELDEFTLMSANVSIIL
ncbi:3-phenylpropionate/cinnamic acid dioxygenase subunit beta [Novosphingobium humi]|uniref:3-phenylpropionate/cinnamic acid dioxygenase subunit beta n=1 Tax=Novosphingobium humi TaxID=2282397 RepID=UPI0025B000BB|nr:3-phenylpropionate/cinnamic acid dioxygenase subunit beta [Novosphingobium humi]WJT00616.1 3-phenylpropionate/cinnamic acid dioxygenase subunit beta [Novosphingobium humi]